ncbi:MAG: hypothetical protein RLZZ387_534 [Chloroflexota bacterium]
MNCTTCGTPLPQGATFCPNCGTRVPQFTSAGIPTTVFAPPPERPEAQGVTPPITLPPPVEYGAPYPTLQTGPFVQQQPTNSTAAIISLVFGILTWTLLPLISAFVAVIAGHMARSEIRRSGGRLSGDGMAVAGMIMGYVQIFLAGLLFCAIVAIGVLTLLGTRAAP